METKRSLLVVDDEQVIRDAVVKYLDRLGYTVFEASGLEDSIEIVDNYDIQIALVDVKLGNFNGIELLRKIKERGSGIEVIMFSGYTEIDMVIEALRNGASDFVKKPFSLEELKIVIERYEHIAHLRSELDHTRENLSLINKELSKKLDYEIVAESKQMQDVFRMVDRIAQTDLTVLITGESGTGKEIVARAIHNLSNRNQEYLYSVNCTAIPSDLFESEFFGFEKSAFTGAQELKKGWFELAHNSTLLLDEIGDLSHVMQGKLLRVLEDRRIHRIGASKDLNVNVRVIAATNKNLHQKVKNDEFREDLFYRLNMFNIHIPPLRERPEDIIPLAKMFIRRIAKSIGKEFQEADVSILEPLKYYHFPGNVRELRNIIERGVLLSRDVQLEAKYFQPFINGNQSGKNQTLKLSELEMQAIEKAMKLSKNKKIQAANILGITIQSLTRRLKKYGME